VSVHKAKSCSGRPTTTVDNYKTSPPPSAGVFSPAASSVPVHHTSTGTSPVPHTDHHGSCPPRGLLASPHQLRMVRLHILLILNIIL